MASSVSNMSRNERKPFMKLDLENVPKQVTKVTFHQQCYKLVPDLSPESDTKFTNQHRVRRQLPSIPDGRKPFERLWRNEIDRSVKGQPGGGGGIRWTRKLATNMLLEIETDPSTGRALSLQVLNHDGPRVEKPEFEPTPPEMNQANEPLPVRSEISFNATLNSDSGLSSNLQSPTVSTNSDTNEFVSPDVVGGEDRKPEATHRALYRFCARHSDEVALEIGDAIHVYAEFEDQWCEGVNIRTGERGIFPVSVITDWEYCEFTELDRFPKTKPPVNFRIQRERYLVDFLGSIEVSEAKGESVLNEAIGRVSAGGFRDISFHCALEVSDIGLRMMDEPRKANTTTTTNTTTSNESHDYFFSLMQITYCGHLSVESNNDYFAFITRHPSNRNRYAAHVFETNRQTSRDVAEAVSQAFRRFYSRFVDLQMESVDIFS